MNNLKQLEQAVGIEHLPAKHQLNLSPIAKADGIQQADVNKITSLSSKPQANSNKIISIH